MSSNKSYAICVQLGSAEIPILTLAFTSDGSFSVQDRIAVAETDSLYQILQFSYPADQVGMGARITLDRSVYYSRNKPKLSHHAQSGLFQISTAQSNKKGARVISGFDLSSGLPKGLGNYSMQLQRVTNDGGPIVGGVFWGLNKMPAGTIRSSRPLVFLENHLRDQTMNNRGAKSAVAVDMFHFLKSKNTLQYLDDNKEWARYLYRHYKRPVLIRMVDPGSKHDYLLGISCMMMRCNDTSHYGYRMGGGPGIVDKETGNCLNTHIMFEMPSPVLLPGAVNIDYQPEPAD